MHLAPSEKKRSHWGRKEVQRICRQGCKGEAGQSCGILVRGQLRQNRDVTIGSYYMESIGDFDQTTHLSSGGVRKPKWGVFKKEWERKTQTW